MVVCRLVLHVSSRTRSVHPNGVCSPSIATGCDLASCVFRCLICWLPTCQRWILSACGPCVHAQGLGKTVSTIALVLAAEAPNMAARARRGSSEDTRYPESSDNSSAYTPDGPSPTAPGDDTATADSATRAGAAGNGGAAAEGPAGEPTAAAGSEGSSEDDDCILVDDAGAAGAPAGKKAAPGADERPWSAGDLRGGTLVVCPTSVLHQWRRELKDKVAQSTGTCFNHCRSHPSRPVLPASLESAGHWHDDVDCSLGWEY